jgi:pantoate--beta-alanine ligase
MSVIVSLSDWRQVRDELPGDATLGFVPTMGALHEGHLSLIRRSRAECDRTVVSVFVNATQFNDPRDLEAYPRCLADDAEMAEHEGADWVLAPPHGAIYADGYRFRVTEREASAVMEGAHRPGHFDGVLTVVLKLLGIVRPHRAYFGEKDYQQYALIRDMCRALFVGVKIVVCPTVRDPDGLALSSRNRLLSPAARERAALFPRLLASDRPLEAVVGELEASGFAVDYVVDRDGRRFGAVHLDGVRLIDNVALVAEVSS